MREIQYNMVLDVDDGLTEEIQYYDNGHLHWKQEWRNGRGRDGAYEEYRCNGALYLKGTYKDDEENGVWEEYNWNGSLQSRITYKDDNIKEKEQIISIKENS